MAHAGAFFVRRGGRHPVPAIDVRCGERASLRWVYNGRMPPGDGPAGPPGLKNPGEGLALGMCIDSPVFCGASGLLEGSLKARRMTYCTWSNTSTKTVLHWFTAGCVRARAITQSCVGAIGRCVERRVERWCRPRAATLRNSRITTHDGNQHRWLLLDSVGARGYLDCHGGG